MITDLVLAKRKLIALRMGTNGGMHDSFFWENLYFFWITLA